MFCCAQPVGNTTKTALIISATSAAANSSRAAVCQAVERERVAHSVSMLESADHSGGRVPDSSLSSKSLYNRQQSKVLALLSRKRLRHTPKWTADWTDVHATQCWLYCGLVTHCAELSSMTTQKWKGGWKGEIRATYIVVMPVSADHSGGRVPVSLLSYNNLRH